MNCCPARKCIPVAKCNNCSEDPDILRSPPAIICTNYNNHLPKLASASDAFWISLSKCYSNSSGVGLILWNTVTGHLKEEPRRVDGFFGWSSLPIMFLRWREAIQTAKKSGRDSPTKYPSLPGKEGVQPFAKWNSLLEELPRSLLDLKLQSTSSQPTGLRANTSLLLRMFNMQVLFLLGQKGAKYI